MTQATEVLFPTSAEDAIAQFGDGGDVTVLGGGTIVMPELTYGRLSPTKVVALARAGLDTLTADGATVTIGAGLPIARLAELAGDVKALAHGSTTRGIDQRTTRHGEQPGLGRTRDALGRPPLERRRQRDGQRIFDQRNITPAGRQVRDQAPVRHARHLGGGDADLVGRPATSVGRRRVAHPPSLPTFLTGRTISLGSLVGFFTVLGIAARNGILMINHYQHLEREEGEPFGLELVLRGSRERLSPILMTTLATALALVPLVVLGNLPGHEIEYPMAVVILGGLVTSTLFTLLVLPAFYLQLHGWRERRTLQSTGDAS